MNRLTKLALRLMCLRTKRQVPRQKIQKCTRDAYTELELGALDKDTLYFIVDPEPTRIDVTTVDGPSFLPADLFKDGGTGNIMVDGIQLSFKDGLPTYLEVNGASYRVLSSEHNDHEFIASIYNPENTTTVRDHLTEAVKRLRAYQP